MLLGSKAACYIEQSGSAPSNKSRNFLLPNHVGVSTTGPLRRVPVLHGTQSVLESYRRQACLVCLDFAFRIRSLPFVILFAEVMLFRWSSRHDLDKLLCLTSHGVGSQVVQAVAAPVVSQQSSQSQAQPVKFGKGSQKPRVVILGSGWGAVSMIRDLPKDIGYMSHT